MKKGNNGATANNVNVKTGQDAATRLASATNGTPANKGMPFVNGLALVAAD